MGGWTRYRPWSGAGIIQGTGGTIPKLAALHGFRRMGTLPAGTQGGANPTHATPRAGNSQHCTEMAGWRLYPRAHRAARTQSVDHYEWGHNLRAGRASNAHGSRGTHSASAASPLLPRRPRRARRARRTRGGSRHDDGGGVPPARHAALPPCALDAVDLRRRTVFQNTPFGFDRSGYCGKARGRHGSKVFIFSGEVARRAESYGGVRRTPPGP